GFDFGPAQAVAGNAKYIIGATQNPEIAIIIALGVVTRHIHALQGFGEIAAAIAIFIPPDSPNHGRPWAADDELASDTRGQLVSIFIHNRGINAWQRQGARAGLQWGRAG